jgi:hypothetical protein
MKKTTKQIENCLFSNLSNMITEHQLGRLTEESIYGYFNSLLINAGVDSEIVVNVLEQFGELGKHEAICIKVNEGW